MAYFASYNVHFFTQIFEGKLGCAFYMIPYRGYNNAVYDMYKNTGVHYTQPNVVISVTELPSSPGERGEE